MGGGGGGGSGSRGGGTHGGPVAVNGVVHMGGQWQSQFLKLKMLIVFKTVLSLCDGVIYVVPPTEPKSNGPHYPSVLNF